MLATWDEHDYGQNDVGAERPIKEQSKQIFLDFFGVAKDSPRRQRDGVYHAEVFGPPGRWVQIILLDTRFNRSPLVFKEDKADRIDGGRYLPNADRAQLRRGREALISAGRSRDAGKPRARR